MLVGEGVTPPAPLPSPFRALLTQRREIVQVGTPVLRSAAKEVPLADIKKPEIQSIITEMVVSMREKGAQAAGRQGPTAGTPLFSPSIIDF